jgi:hypothetical protein
LPPKVRQIDGGELYAQLEAPTRVRDMTTGKLRYKWTESGALDHCRHAHAFDLLAGFSKAMPRGWPWAEGRCAKSRHNWNSWEMRAEKSGKETAVLVRRSDRRDFGPAFSPDYS